MYEILDNDVNNTSQVGANSKTHNYMIGFILTTKIICLLQRFESDYVKNVVYYGL